MSLPRLATIILLAPLSACAVPGVQYVPSSKSAVELRSVQTRLVPGSQDTVMRGVIGTLHDLGYRITKVEPGAGTVSATRQTALRMAVVVRPTDNATCAVRANATIVAIGKEAQVDSPAFYQQDFYLPLGASLQRQIATLPDDVAAPEAMRPAGELNTANERKAAAKAVSSTSGTGT